MKELTKANTSQARLSTRSRLLLVPVCLAIAWLGFWAYVVLADAPATGSEAGANTSPGASDEAVTLAATATMRIDPLNSTVEVGDIFSVTVAIDNVTNLAAFQFDLNYNSGVVQPGTDPASDCVRLGPFLGSTGRSVNKIGPTISDGLITYGAYTLDPPSMPGPSGSGTLATITFKAVAIGTTVLSLKNESATDPVGASLAVDVQDGQIEVGPDQANGFYIYLPLVLNN
jgi:hypothetical protein